MRQPRRNDKLLVSKITQPMSDHNQLPDPATARQLTQALSDLQKGQAGAADELLRLVYDELRQLARSRLAREAGGGAGMTLQATALVHEAYLRLIGPQPKSND